MRAAVVRFPPAADLLFEDARKLPGRDVENPLGGGPGFENASLRIQPMPGWTVTLTTPDLANPLEFQGQTIPSYVSVIEFLTSTTWTPLSRSCAQ